MPLSPMNVFLQGRGMRPLLAIGKCLVPELLRGAMQGPIGPLERVVLCSPEALVRGEEAT